MTTIVTKAITRHIRKADNGCWIWTATKTRDGYAKTCYKRKRCMAHRLIYEYLRGPILPGLQLDHICRNRLCVNPDHMEPVTRKENMRRARLFRPIKLSSLVEGLGC